MAVFFDNGFGDWYGGDTREQVLACMKADDFDGRDFGKLAKELPADTKMGVTDENERFTGEFITLAEYMTSGPAQMIASQNQ